MKKLLLVLLIGFLFAIPGQSQSLKEKQAFASLDFSWAETRIKDNLGTAVKIELDQSSFIGDMNAIQYADSRGATHAANAIAKICDDAIGKKALQDKKLTKVVLKNIKTGQYKAEIKAGVLTVFSGFSSSDNYFGESELKEAIENLL